MLFLFSSKVRTLFHAWPSRLDFRYEMSEGKKTCETGEKRRPKTIFFSMDRSITLNVPKLKMYPEIQLYFEDLSKSFFLPSFNLRIGRRRRVK